ITPDKKDIYITINLTEGDLFSISGINLAGDFVLPEEELFESIEVKKGELFSRVKVTKSAEAITDQLGNQGYAFANVNSIPEISLEDKTVAITFFVDPGKRAYVRRINFVGNTRTSDEVLRREMRQPESAWISTTKVERGKVRLQRLGYFDEVNVETPAVPETTDQVDVNYTVVEHAAGRLMAGVGFSQSAGIIFQTSVVQDNFLGSGKRVSFEFNNSDINQRFGLGYLNPYWTVDGISRGFNAYYRSTDAEDANLLAYNSTVRGAAVIFGIPLTEYNYLSSTLGYEDTEIDCNSLALNNTCRDFVDDIGSDRYNILKWTNRFAYDTRNKAIFPDEGVLHSIVAEVTFPSFGNSLEYYRLDYETQWFTNWLEEYILLLKANLGYGSGYGDTEELPFFENFYAGGPRSVRGYE
ncbi:MAG: outer membrane protein assembly factor BamA, partial [Gammaproteobacteria bacterium]